MYAQISPVFYRTSPPLGPLPKNRYRENGEIEKEWVKDVEDGGREENDGRRRYAYGSRKEGVTEKERMNYAKS